jgi:hypothetical protein
VATSSDKLKTAVKMKNWVCLKITGHGKKIHRLKIPFFCGCSYLINSTLLAGQNPNEK